jgi:homopolymeric O-antigen transport system ATP-binding protein
MSSDAIAIEKLGKRYTIGARQLGNTTFRESLTSMVTAPWRRFRHLSGNAEDATQFWALQDVSFSVGVGEVIGIVGANGAGKSTLLKILSRITAPTTGFVDLTGRVSSLLEVGTGFHPELTGRENVFLNGAILGMYRTEIRRKFDAIVAFAELEPFIDTPVKHYSSGMFVRLAFSVAAHLDPEILIVDEVLSVGDVHFRKRCLGRMQDLRSEGRTVLFVSHDLTSVRQLCTRALLLSAGRVVDDGTPADITRRYERQHHDGAVQSSAVDRIHPPRGYHLRRVELRNGSGTATSRFDAGETMEIHLWASGPAPENSYTVEFKLLDDDDQVISFGAANPVQNTYYRAEHQHFVCRVGPLPLTEGVYSLSFTVGVWNVARWDAWSKAIGFTVERCDLFNTGHGVSNVHDGDFVLPQEWLVGS